MGLPAERGHFLSDTVQACFSAVSPQAGLGSTATWRRLPRRGYATVPCTLDMGLHAGEIVILFIYDIDWREGIVNVATLASIYMPFT